MADDTKAGAVQAPATPALRGGNVIEQAMTKVLDDVRIESEEIWNREGMDQEEKIDPVNLLNDPDVIQQRMLKAREAAAASLAAFESGSLVQVNKWISGKPSGAA